MSDYWIVVSKESALGFEYAQSHVVGSHERLMKMTETHKTPDDRKDIADISHKKGPLGSCHCSKPSSEEPALCAKVTER